MHIHTRNIASKDIQGLLMDFLIDGDGVQLQCIHQSWQTEIVQ